MERWNSNLPDQNKGLQIIVTIAGKETEKNKSSFSLVEFLTVQ